MSKYVILAGAPKVRCQKCNGDGYVMGPSKSVAYIMMTYDTKPFRHECGKCKGAGWTQPQQDEFDDAVDRYNTAVENADKATDELNLLLNSKE